MMKTVEVKVLDGTVYTLKDSLSAGDAIEYIKTFMTRDETPIDADITQEKKDKTFGDVMLQTCKNLEDVDWLTRHVVVKPSDGVPLHHAYELIAPMRRAVRFEELMEVVRTMQQPPDPDFPEDESKN
jgi:hypothetical protein